MDEVQETKPKPAESAPTGDGDSGDSKTIEKSDDNLSKFDFSTLVNDGSLNFELKSKPEEKGDKKEEVKKKETTKSAESKTPNFLDFGNPFGRSDSQGDKKAEEKTEKAEKSESTDKRDVNIPITPGFDISKFLPTQGEPRGMKQQFPLPFNNGDQTKPTPGPGNQFPNFFNGDSPLSGFLKNPEVQARLKQRMAQVGEVLNHPEVKPLVSDALKQMTGISVDSDKGEMTIENDFAALYDKSVAKDSPEYSQETREMLSHLKNVKITGDTIRLAFDSPQSMKAEPGSMFNYDLGTAQDGNEHVVTMNYSTTENSLEITDIKGMGGHLNVMDKSIESTKAKIAEAQKANKSEAQIRQLQTQLALMEKAQRKVRVHEIKLDTSDPDKPVGKVKTDNPLPPIPGFKYHETKETDLKIDQKAEKELVEKLPAAIKTLDAIVSGVKSGDISQTMQKLDMESVITMLGWTMNNKGSINSSAIYTDGDPRPDLYYQNEPGGKTPLPWNPRQGRR